MVSLFEAVAPLAVTSPGRLDHIAPEEEIIPALVPVLLYFKQAREHSETLGDFCQRKGVEDLLAFAAASAAPASA